MNGILQKGIERINWIEDFVRVARGLIVAATTRTTTPATAVGMMLLT